MIHNVPAPPAPRPCILPLPDEVVAQIKSSTAIVSLTGVLLELLKNSLDAKAAKIDAAVDFARGACTVDDDGLGISPSAFREGGGLGQLYWTSKYHADEVLLGRNGTFLASLAAMSLVTVTSRHHEHRSHSQITFHHSRTIERQVPASVGSEIHGKHGTRVTVKNLFGNLPVRVKQRSIALEQKPELHRLWDVLRKTVTSLLLSWRGAVSLKIRDGDNKTVLNFNTADLTNSTQTCQQYTAKPRSASLSSLLTVLTQANYIAVDEWASWVPASASTSALSIKGAISLDPAPTKTVQFISLGVQPLLVDSGRNELYDEINRLFALSSFGTIENDTDIDDQEKIRRQTDKRFKKDGYTNRQLTARKDVDRHPMFHLRISLNGPSSADTSEDQLVADDSNLQAVIEVLGAMVTQWLVAHHFRPRQPRKKRIQPDTLSTALSDTSEVDNISPSESEPASRPARRSIASSELSRPSSTTSMRKRKRRPTAASREPSEKLPHRAFAEWSRIKSGKSGFFDSLSSLPKFPRSASDTALGFGSGAKQPHHTKDSTFAAFQVEPVPQGALSLHTAPDKSSGSANQSCMNQDTHDDTILWMEPSTKKTYHLNARTGCVLPNGRPRPHTDPAASMFARTQQDVKKSLRLMPKTATLIPGKTPWLDHVLPTWVNPIFKPSENRIPQVSLEDRSFDNGSHQCLHHQYVHKDMEKAFTEMSVPSSSRLSREGLGLAKVIAQVDKKFILIKMPKASGADHASNGSDQLLVLIDQHAADERVQVETLLKELSTPLESDSNASTYQSKLGLRAQVASTLLEKPLQFAVSSEERTHFITHAARFAAWGILFDVSDPRLPSSQSGMSSKDQCQLSVTALPPGISERCKADPTLLISLLRSTVWKYAEDLHLTPLSSSTPSNKESDWVRRLATCPPGLVDLINSRACRSAIMFNDMLSHEECEDLVKKLATCVFPFMCAHGRPSMVPLVDLGRIGDTAGEQSAEQVNKDT